MRYALQHGPFGTAVCDLLAAGRWQVRDWSGAADAVAPAAAASALTAPATAGDWLLVATWRDLPDLEAVDAAAHRAGHGWLPVVHEHPYLRIGPLIEPGSGPCLRCYYARNAQHTDDSPTVRAARGAYADDPALGPTGHLSSHVAVAVALIGLMLPDTGTGLWPPGTVARWHVISQELTVDRVVGTHACPRCGIRRTRMDRALAVAAPSGADGPVRPSVTIGSWA